jgi:hypothetical protein
LLDARRQKGSAGAAHELCDEASHGRKAASVTLRAFVRVAVLVVHEAGR